MTPCQVEIRCHSLEQILHPDDEFNRSLLHNVRPAEWVNPEPKQIYNLVVIGAGAAGLVSAAGAAGLGARVAIVERQFFGGDCLNFGCVPSKALPGVRACPCVHPSRDPIWRARHRGGDR